jgi:hypothetical protein
MAFLSSRYETAFKHFSYGVFFLFMIALLLALGNLFGIGVPNIPSLKEVNGDMAWMVGQIISFGQTIMPIIAGSASLSFVYMSCLDYASGDYRRGLFNLSVCALALFVFHLTLPELFATIVLSPPQSNAEFVSDQTPESSNGYGITDVQVQNVLQAISGAGISTLPADFSPTVLRRLPNGTELHFTNVDAISCANLIALLPPNTATAIIDGRPASDPTACFRGLWRDDAVQLSLDVTRGPYH